MITPDQLRRRCAAVMLSYELRGYTVRVGRISGGTTWAHCDFNKRELLFTPSLLECDWVFVNQIILHEVAHGLAGPCGHSRKWLNKARSIGYRLGAMVPYSNPVQGEHKWVVMCATMQHSAIKYEKEYEDAERDCYLCYQKGDVGIPVFWEAL